MSSGVLDSHHEKMKSKSMEMKAKWDAMTDEEKEAIYENLREQARLAEEEYLRKQKARQERYAKFVLDPQKAKDRSGKATKGNNTCKNIFHPFYFSVCRYVALVYWRGARYLERSWYL